MSSRNIRPKGQPSAGASHGNPEFHPKHIHRDIPSFEQTIITAGDALRDYRRLLQNFEAELAGAGQPKLEAAIKRLIAHTDPCLHDLLYWELDPWLGGLIEGDPRRIPMD
jgi:hypothetical protein